MNSESLVTCIIPTCDRPSLLRRALDSVLGQTYEKIEVIVVVSPPHAPIRRLLNEYKTENTRLRPFYIDEEPGAEVARNLGIREASGDYIAFLDDDDVWKPEKIEKQIPLVSTYSIVSCLLTVMTEDGTKDIEPTDGVVKEMNIERAFYYHSILVPSCLMFRTSELRAVGGYDENIRWGGTWDLSLKIMNRYDACYILDNHLILFDREHDQERYSTHEENENLEQASEVYHRHKDKVEKQTARRTWVKIKYAYYREIQNINRYKHLLLALTRDYELTFIRNGIKDNIREIQAHLKWF